MPTEQQLKDQARSRARSLLATSQSFHALDKTEQMALYKEMVDAEYRQLSAPNGNGTAIAMSRHETAVDDFERGADNLAGLIDQVDFPQFVSDLLKGVFDANLDVTVKQMQTYMDLMKAATASLTKFVKDIHDTEAFGYLAENSGDEFSVIFPEDESEEPKLADKEGNELDVGDNAVKVKIMDAKIALAKEHRALLRETLLMGVSRLVVEKGTVKANVNFNIQVKDDTTTQRRGMQKTDKTSGGTFGGGFFGLFGGRHTSTKKVSTITVASTKERSTTDMSADLHGSVEIQFKSDYFALDNFAQMYGPIQGEAQAIEAAKKETGI